MYKLNNTPDAKKPMPEPPRLQHKRQHEESDDDEANHRTIRPKIMASEHMSERTPRQSIDEQTSTACGSTILTFTPEELEQAVQARINEAINKYDVEQIAKRREERIKDAVLVRDKLQKRLIEVRKQDLETMRNAVQQKVKTCRKDAIRIMRCNLIYNLQHYIKTLKAADDLVEMKHVGSTVLC